MQLSWTLLVLFGILIIGFAGFSQDAYATDNNLDQEFCDTIVGSWNENTCTVGAFTNLFDDTLTIESGVALVITGNFINHGDTNNFGNITVNNFAFINNLGNITNSDTIVINTDGTFNNGGTITNNADSTITNDGRIHNTSILDNSGTITVSNTINTGIESPGTITNNSGGVITISNTGVFAVGIDNFGTLTNNSGGVITISNTGSGGIGINNHLGTLTNNSGGLITVSNTGGTGIGNFIGTITNNSGGVITVSNTVGAGINNTIGTISNFGTIAISGSITNSDILNNPGSIFNCGTFTGIITSGNDLLTCENITLSPDALGGFFCGVIDGIWSENTCTAGAFTINADDTLTIESGVTLVITGNFINHGDTNNFGNITVNNLAFINNLGTITNSNTIVINEGGTIIIANTGGTGFTNSSTVTNSGAINKQCFATYTGTLPTGNPIVDICVFCSPSVNWIVTSSCYLSTSTSVVGNVIIQNNSSVNEFIDKE